MEEKQSEVTPIYLSVITAHPSSMEIPTLRGSIEQNLGIEQTELIVTVGASSICKAYNQGAKMAKGKYLLFTHSDVELCTSRFMMGVAIDTCSKPGVGIVGIAGTRVLGEKAIWWKQGDQLSGACMHTDGKQTWMTSFGPYSQVVVLDGVFLLMRREVFDALGGFNEEIEGWDFYDIDITLRAYLAGYANTTFPLHVLHKSQGDVSDKPGWHRNREAFAKKHKDILPLTVGLRNPMVSPVPVPPATSTT